jgi:hypothetical protein
MSISKGSFVFVLLVAALPVKAWAHGAGGDIALFSTGGQADVGFAILDDDDIEQVVFDPNVNVFMSVLLPQSPNPIVPWEFGSPEPGLDSNEGTLPASAEIRINLLELLYWDGTGPVAFAPAVGINGGFAPQPMQSFPDGGFHSHPLFGVENPTGVAPSGVYVGKFTVSVTGLTDSDPFYMVSLVADGVNGLADEEDRIEAAEMIGEMVRLFADDPLGNPDPVFGGVDYTYFANAVSAVRTMAAVPEPGSLVIVGIMTVAAFACRRRAR